MESSRNSRPIPPYVVGRLFRIAGLNSGHTVLDVGCGTGLFVSAAMKRGVDAFGIDDEPAWSEATNTDGSRLTATTPEKSIPFPPHTFDVVLIRGMQVYSTAGPCPAKLAATANLLSVLKPAGRLIVWLPPGVQAARRDAFATVLGSFRGTDRELIVSEGLTRFVKPTYLLGRRGRYRLHLLVHEIPPRTISRLAWHRMAHEAATSGQHNSTERAA